MERPRGMLSKNSNKILHETLLRIVATISKYLKVLITSVKELLSFETILFCLSLVLICNSPLLVQKLGSLQA